MLGKDGLARGIKKLRTRSFTQTVGVAQKGNNTRGFQ